MNERGAASNERRCPQCRGPLPAGALEGLCPACLLQQGAAPPTQPHTAFEPPSLETVRTLFPHLEILEFIGRGGMGAVYKARQTGLNRLVALKILPSQSSPDFAERFTREARALAQLNHPNIVAVYDFGQVTGGLHYLLMEFVDGLNLRQIERAGQLAPREALRIIPEICAALQYAHDEGIVHRDIKPENVLIDKKGRVKIADFGLAKMLGQASPASPLTGAGQVMGTPHYMAPEQVEHPAEVDHRADIFSLGVVFYEMLTGELPLGRFAPPSRKVQIDVRLDEVVLRALEKEPDLRYGQVREMKTQVETIAHSPGVKPFPRSTPAGESESIHRTIAWHCAILVVFTGFLGHFVPVTARSWESLSLHLPPITELLIQFSKLVQQSWFILLPLALVLDFGVLAGIRRLWGRRACSIWSATFVSGTLLATGMTVWGLLIPYSTLVSSLGPTVESNPPVVVETVPASGSDSVQAGITEIQARFSKDMNLDSSTWSTAWEDSAPELIEPPKFLDDHRTCVLKVKLKPGKTYGYWLNSENFHGFRDAAGKVAIPYLLVFRTREE